MDTNDDQRKPGGPRTPKMEFGTQPLDHVLREHGITNHALAGASTDQLTHKVIAKGRRGRRLTLKAQMKIIRALTNLLKNRNPESTALPKRGDLFNYNP